MNVEVLQKCIQDFVLSVYLYLKSVALLPVPSLGEVRTEKGSLEII